MKANRAVLKASRVSHAPHTSQLSKTSKTAMAMRLLLVAALVAPSLSSPFLGSRDDYPTYLCDDGWTLVDKTCFLVSTNISGSWLDGKDFCSQKGAALATISSETVQEQVSGLLTESAWIGLNDLEESDTFVWADGSEVNYMNWDDGEPNNKPEYLFWGAREDCVEMRRDVGYKWNDEQCQKEREFVCSTLAEVITTTTTTTTPAPTCDEGWDMFESSCYQVSDTKVSWEEAKTICNDQNADLVSITSESEQNYLAGRITQNTWIGLSDMNETRTFTWEDCSDVTYTNWSEGEPNNFKFGFEGFGKSEDCVEMRKEDGYEWNDKYCGTINGYICETVPT